MQTTAYKITYRRPHWPETTPDATKFHLSGLGLTLPQAADLVAGCGVEVTSIAKIDPLHALDVVNQNPALGRLLD